MGILYANSIGILLKDDEPEEVIYHQSYVKGKLNDTEISMNDINALVSSANLIINLLSEK